ncbi:MAG TPA: MBL fold metallo-hydrolase [Acidobacteriota bacterium]|nr:MBL fold metallo-hydrolase [Acidobacteriota bacterium]
MRIHFLGGAQTVTGSQFLLQVEQTRFLIECGLFQGRRSETYLRNKTFRYDPASLDFVLLSHAHIDHSGNIPNLVKSGFNGTIYATTATVDLCQLMLRDSAYLHERDAQWVNKIRGKKGEGAVEPLYTIDDAEAAMNQFVGIPYNRPFRINDAVSVTFRDAGHILGSAGILLEIHEKYRKIRLGFSGDVGRKSMPILRDPDYLRGLDVMILESTYGNRIHRPSTDMYERLSALVEETTRLGGRIIIPAFAVGRTQLLVYMLHKLTLQNRIRDIPIFVDSPLACNATEVFRLHPECFDRETHRLFFRNQMDPFGFDRLEYIHDVEESKRLNSLNYPHIVISASGMAEGGRVLHHLKHSIGDPRSLVLFVGYAAAETLARKLIDGHQQVRIFGEEYQVRCKVAAMDDFSAHADRDQLLEYVSLQSPSRLKHLFLVHGEPEQAIPLQSAIRERGFRRVEYPAYGDVVEL